MSFEVLYQSKKMGLENVLSIFRPQDSVATSIAAGQPRTLLNQLSEKSDLESLELFTGLVAFPYPLLMNPKVKIGSGYYGPIERMLNEAGANIAYLPLSFSSFPDYVNHKKYRVVATTFSAMDAEGYLSFGLNCEAVYSAVVRAIQDPDRIVIGEINPQMPVIHGIPELGDNKIHISELDALIESDQGLLTLPASELSDADRKIAEQVVALIRDRDTLQFGIGAIPNEVARLLAESSKGGFGVHSELISDGFLMLMEAGKINGVHKQLNPHQSVFAFALGSEKLYQWLDERRWKNKRKAVAAPVSYVNDPSIIAQHANMVSVNSGLMIDFSGQVCSEAIGEKQYSGVGGQLSFVQGAFQSPGGRSILCIKSSVLIDGKRFSNIVASFPAGSMISTPRHYVQWIVTEYGAVNLYGLTDEERPDALIPLAHPDFRDQLLEEAKRRDALYYKSKRV